MISKLQGQPESYEKKCETPLQFFAISFPRSPLPLTLQIDIDPHIDSEGRWVQAHMA